MVVNQIKVTMDNLRELSNRDDLFVVRYAKPSRRDLTKHPYGISFKQIVGTFTIPQLFELLDGDAAVIEICDETNYDFCKNCLENEAGCKTNCSAMKGENNAD